MSAYGFPIRIPPDLLDELGHHTGHFRSTLNLEFIICDMIRDYMAPPLAVEQAPPAAASDAGYQWKEMFLPAGTKLRASFDGKPYFAVVQGAEIKYGERAISPSRFANIQGSGNRNAWKAIWLRLPGSDQWLLAEVFRSARKGAIARLMGGDAPETRERRAANGSRAIAPPKENGTAPMAQSRSKYPSQSS